MKAGLQKINLQGVTFITGRCTNLHLAFTMKIMTVVQTLFAIVSAILMRIFLMTSK
jgi:hypothetical protein